MRMEIFMDGVAVVKADVNVPKLMSLLKSAVERPSGPAKSEPMTPDQAEELVRRVHASSANFLKQIAERDGQLTWSEMRKIFGYQGKDWTAFSNSHNRGINNSLGAILNKTGVRLVHWDDDEPEWGEEGWDNARVYVDGQALQSLKAAFQIQN